MVEEQTQQVNDDDVSNKAIRQARGSKIIAQVALMADEYADEIYDLESGAVALMSRCADFITELRQQRPAEYQLGMGGIPKMPVGDSED